MYYVSVSEANGLRGGGGKTYYFFLPRSSQLSFTILCLQLQEKWEGGIMLLPFHQSPPFDAHDIGYMKYERSTCSNAYEM